jgi:hypothetical protein
MRSGARQDLAAQGLAGAREERVRGPHRAQVGDKREHIGVANNCAVEIDDRQRQARPLRELPKRAHVDEGRDPRRRAAENLALGGGQALAKLGQRLAPDQRRDKQAIGFQRAPHLNQRARQIVHGLQRQERDGEVKAAIPDWQPLKVADGRQKSACSQGHPGRGDPDGAVDLAACGERDRAVGAGRAEIGGEGEAPFDQRQPFAKVLSRASEEEVHARVAGWAGPGAIEASIDERAIK